MNEINKSEYPLIDKLMNSLLDKFKAQGWSFPEILPKIYFSDKVILLPTDDKNGLQGYYPNLIMTPLNNNEAVLLSDYKYDDKTPIIIIYENVLLETAKKMEKDELYKRDILCMKQEGIDNDYGISFEKARENLFYCAVLNEFSKWILVDTPIKDTWKDNPLYKKNHLHECLTALLTYWICKEGSKELNNSFVYLMSLHKKVGEYNRYSNYIESEIASVINCIAICRNENYEYFELLDLLLEISKKDNTLNSNNFKHIIISNNIQNIVKDSYTNHISKVHGDKKLTDILYELFNNENKENYDGSQIGKEFGI